MTFEAMRRDLQARGLIDDKHRLTPAGDAYCVALLVRLDGKRAWNDPGRTGRRWDMRWPHERPVDGAVNSA